MEAAVVGELGMEGCGQEVILARRDDRAVLQLREDLDTGTVDTAGDAASPQASRERRVKAAEQQELS